MAEVTSRQPTNEKIKGYLRNLPIVYGAGKWIYRRFRQSDPTIEERILKAVGSKPAVFFVQVGSNDGVQSDPVHALIVSRDNWSGIFIEPVDFFFQRLRNNYRDAERFVFENVAIGNEKGRRSLYYVSELAKSELDLPYWHEGLGSFDRSHITRALGDEISPYIVEADVECVPFQEVMDRNQVDAVDLLHIDTEGFDYQVLSQVDFRRYKPLAILFEHQHLSDEEFSKACKLLRRAGYRLIHCGQDILATRRAFWIG